MTTKRANDRGHTNIYLHWRETEQIATSAAQVNGRKGVISVTSKAKRELTIAIEAIYHLFIPFVNARCRFYQHFYYLWLPRDSRGQNKGLTLNNTMGHHATTMGPHVKRTYNKRTMP